MAGETLIELAMTNMLESVDVGGDCDGLGGWLLQSLPGVALHCCDLGVALLTICSVKSTLFANNHKYIYSEWSSHLLL